MHWITKVKIYLHKKLIVNDKINIDNVFINITFKVLIKVFKLKIQIVEINELINYDRNIIAKLEPIEKFTSYGPKTMVNEISKDILINPLNIYQFKNSNISSRNSAIHYEEKLIVERDNKYLNFKSGFVLKNRNKYAWLNNNQRVKISEGFFLAGKGSWNWYHWLIEILPKLLFLNQIPTNTLLISEVVLNIPSMKETLEMVCKGSDVKIIYLDDLKIYNIENLYHINELSNVPFSLFKNKTPRIEDVFMRKKPLIRLQQKLNSSIEITTSYPDQIFLYRSSNHRLAKNQDELVKALKEKNIISIDFNTLTFSEQKAYMQNANLIIGISGAAFTNIMFAKPNTKVICLMQKSIDSFSCYSNLAKIFNIELYYQFYTANANANDHYSNEFTVNIVEVLSLYNKLIHE